MCKESKDFCKNSIKILIYDAQLQDGDEAFLKACFCNRLEMLTVLINSGTNKDCQDEVQVIFIFL